MRFPTSLLLALASIGFFTLAAAPAVSQVEPQGPPDGSTGGLAANEDALESLKGGMPVVSTLQQKAQNAYNRGLEHRDKASRLEEQAARAEGDKTAKKAAKAQKYYQKAIEQFRVAVEQVPGFYQALGCLGHALLRTGQYEEALDAYDRALTVGPLYPEAIEERGEVYLGLDRIEEAKGAYMLLTRIDRESAARLMTAMKRWLDQQRGDADGLSEETIESFAVWIQERSEPVAQVLGIRA